MNPYLIAVKKSLLAHGTDATYTAVTEGTYNVETGSTTNSESTSTVRVFPKNVKVNNYNYPNLIGKKVIEFLIAGDAISSPDTQDFITYNSEKYLVNRYSSHTAQGEIALYKVLCVKG